MFSKGRLLKYSLAGFLLQVVWFFASGFLGQAVRDFNETVYLPWASLGEYAAPSGPGGHAMPGGAILGILVGVILYSLSLGSIFYIVGRANRS